MENASKALLIAAAVLVVILIIAFGMQIMNSSSGTTEQVGSTMSSSEAQAFNSQFTGYKGTQKASAVRNLIIAVAQSKKANPTYPVTLKEATNSVTSLADTDLKEGSSYKVELTYEEDPTKDNLGYIKEITITRIGS